MKLQNLKRQLQLQEWASQINSQRQSGMTVRQWCEMSGIGYKNFYYRMKRVQEELLEALETRSEKTEITDLATINDIRTLKTAETPIFTPITMPQAKGAAVTVWVGTHAIDIQNGADGATVEQVLKAVSQL